MTFLELQNDVMSRLNWTSTDARALVKRYLNQRYREVCSSVSLALTRRGTVTFTTTSGQNTVTATGIAKLIDLIDAVTLKRPLRPRTIADLRAKDPAGEQTGPPEEYAVLNHENDEITLLLFPKPDAVYNLTGDALLAGTDMSGDSDEPTIPDDFQDVLIHGAEADGRVKMDKPKQAIVSEGKFEKRLSELRYFLVKSAHLSRNPQDNLVTQGLTRRTWPYSNLA